MSRVDELASRAAQRFDEIHRRGDGRERGREVLRQLAAALVRLNTPERVRSFAQADLAADRLATDGHGLRWKLADRTGEIYRASIGVRDDEIGLTIEGDYIDGLGKGSSFVATLGPEELLTLAENDAEALDAMVTAALENLVAALPPNGA